MDEAAQHQLRMQEIEAERLHTTEEMLSSLTGSKRRGGIVNNYFNYIKPPPGPIPWYCHKGHGTMKMNLYPSDRREPAQFWQCVSCERRISIDRRNKTFLEVTEEIKDLYDLKILQYNRANNIWKMESNVWIDDRLRGKVKPIPTSLRNDIIRDFISLIERSLEIEVESMKDFFIE